MTRREKIVTALELAFMAVVLALGGCATPDTTTTTVTKYVVVHPSAALIADCPDTVAPPDPETYVASSAKVKERMMAEYASAQQVERQKCNARWAGVRSWFSDQDKVYAAPQGASAPTK